MRPHQCECNPDKKCFADCERERNKSIGFFMLTVIGIVMAFVLFSLKWMAHN